MPSHQGPAVITTLADLRSGQTATLRRVGGERAWRRRLLELGFVPGTDLALVRRVGVGDLLEVELRHSRISLRISEARALEVEARP
ncbi:MAG: ferrous iron transport protein A [Planctomycetes bacterium]|nr:ferrous iron transport protein A [Planctomycetota bacterium]